MPLLNIESYVFINLFYLVLFCIRFCVDDIREKKKFDNGKTIAYKLKFIDSFKFMPTLLSSLVDNLSEIYSKECKRCKERKKLNQDVILSVLKIINYKTNPKNVKIDS